MATTKVTGDLIADNTITTDNTSVDINNKLSAITVTTDEDGVVGNYAIGTDSETINVNSVTEFTNAVEFSGTNEDINFNGAGTHVTFADSQIVTFGNATVDVAGPNVSFPQSIYNQFQWDQDSELASAVEISSSSNLADLIAGYSVKGVVYEFWYNIESHVIQIRFTGDRTAVIPEGSFISLLLNNAGTDEANPITGYIYDVRLNNAGDATLIYMNIVEDANWTFEEISARIAVLAGNGGTVVGNKYYPPAGAATTFNVRPVLDNVYHFNDFPVQGWQYPTVAIPDAGPSLLGHYLSTSQHLLTTGHLQANSIDLTPSSVSLDASAAAVADHEFAILYTTNPNGISEGSHVGLSSNTFLRAETRGDLVTLFGNIVINEIPGTHTNSYFSIATQVDGKQLPVVNDSIRGIGVGVQTTGGNTHSIELSRNLENGESDPRITNQQITVGSTIFEITNDTVLFRIGDEDGSGSLQGDEIAASTSISFTVTYLKN